MCPGCIAVMGRHKPEKFPTVEEYEAAKARFSAPIWESGEEATAAWKDGAAHEAALEESRIDRSEATACFAGEAAVVEALKRSDAFNDAFHLLEKLPDEAFGYFDRVLTARVLSEAACAVNEELGRYKEAFGIPAS